MRRTAYLGVLVVSVSLLIGTGGVPLYDGIGFPDEPYRYVKAPHGYQQKYRPTDANATLTMARGSNRTEGLISSGESGPQVALYIPVSELHIRTAATRVAVRARPVAASSLPTDGAANSNAYDVDLGPDPVTFSGDPPNVPNIALREAVFQTVLAVMEYRPTRGSPWRRLHTEQVGRDIFLGFLQGPGEYVLVQPATGTPHTSRNSGNSLQLVLIVAFCVLVMGIVVLGVRRTSQRAQRG